MTASLLRFLKVRPLRFAVLTVFAAALTASAIELRPFDAESFREITKAKEGRAFVLAFWSIHCAPCKEEMGLFRTISRKYPTIPIILVATDGPKDSAAIIRFLEKQELKGVDTRIFADEFTERVLYSVDRQWMGELPRTYFFDAPHRTTAHSGLLDPAWVEKWMNEQSAADRK